MKLTQPNQQSISVILWIGSVRFSVAMQSKHRQTHKQSLCSVEREAELSSGLFISSNRKTFVQHFAMLRTHFIASTQSVSSLNTYTHTTFICTILIVCQCQSIQMNLWSWLVSHLYGFFLYSDVFPIAFSFIDSNKLQSHGVLLTFFRCVSVYISDFGFQDRGGV